MKPFFSTILCRGLVLSAVFISSACNKKQEASSAKGPKSITQANPNSPAEGDSEIPPEIDPNASAPIQFRARAFGYSGISTTTVPANKVLKIKFTPGREGENTTGTAGAPANRELYSRLQVFIAIDNATADCNPAGLGIKCKTPGSQNNGAKSGTSPSSGIVDFSGVFNNFDCVNSTDPLCRVPVKITVMKPFYDYYCFHQAENGFAANECDVKYKGIDIGLRPLYSNSAVPLIPGIPNHPWNGTLEIQTDDTQAVQ